SRTRSPGWRDHWPPDPDTVDAATTNSTSSTLRMLNRLRMRSPTNLHQLDAPVLLLALGRAVVGGRLRLAQAGSLQPACVDAERAHEVRLHRLGAPAREVQVVGVVAVAVGVA